MSSKMLNVNTAESALKKVVGVIGVNGFTDLLMGVENAGGGASGPVENPPVPETVTAPDADAQKPAESQPVPGEGTPGTPETPPAAAAKKKRQAKRKVGDIFRGQKPLQRSVGKDPSPANEDTTPPNPEDGGADEPVQTSSPAAIAAIAGVTEPGQPGSPAAKAGALAKTTSKPAGFAKKQVKAAIKKAFINEQIEQFLPNQERVVELQNELGLTWRPLTLEEAEGVKLFLPSYDGFLQNALKMYAFIWLYVLSVKHYGAKQSAFTASLIQAVLRRAEERDIKQMHLILTPQILTGSREDVLYRLFDATMNRTHRLVIVGDTQSDVSYYKLKRKEVGDYPAPNYEKIAETEVLRLISTWLSSLFDGLLPESVSTPGFIRTFLQWLQINTMISETHFRETYKRDGFPFRNCFAQLVEGKPRLQEVAYSDAVMVLGNPIDNDYRQPVIKDGVIFCHQETFEFINVISGGSYVNSLIFRSMVRRVATARVEGAKFQSGFFLWGPPATSKSTVVEILKKVAGKDNYTEFSREQNQFTPGQLKGKGLLIVSDLTYLTEKQNSVIKRVLGRDTLTLEKKNDPEFGTIEPYCQIVIVTNNPLTNFPSLANDQAVVDKLIVWTFTPEDQIPAELQVANISAGLDFYLVDLINWAMHIPAEVLASQIRALRFNALQAIDEDQQTGLAAFIKEKCWYASGAFTPITEIAASAELYSKKSGDDSLESLKQQRKQSDLGARIVSTCSARFGKTVVYGRSKRMIEGQRPSGITNLLLKKSHAETPPPGALSLTFISNATPIEVPNPEEASEHIVWLKTTSSEIVSVQRAILDYRAKRLAERGKAEQLAQLEASANPAGEEEEPPLD